MSRFVVLEGLDGAGTTTQCAELVRWLRSRGQDVVHTKEPTDGPVGQVIRTTLRGEPGAPDVSVLPWLFAADRADHLTRTIEPALDRGAWVVSDRYYHSSLAYQSLTLPLDQVLQLNPFRAPDLTVFLDVSVDTCLDRIEARQGAVREIYEQRAELERIERRYLEVVSRKRAEGERVLILDGQLEVGVIAEAIRTQLEELEPLL